MKPKAYCIVHPATGAIMARGLTRDTAIRWARSCGGEAHVDPRPDPVQRDLLGLPETTFRPRGEARP